MDLPLRGFPEYTARHGWGRFAAYNYNPLGAHIEPLVRMKRYRNLSGDSGVVAYEICPAAIVVQFQGGEKYEYTELSAGAVVIAAMQQLARSGRGLSTFIAQHRPGYARTLP